MSDFSLNVKINGAETAVSSIGEIEAALKATKAELKGVEIGSEAFEELSAQARILQDELKDSFKEATNFDKNLGKLTESVSRLGSTVAAGFSIAISSFSILGKESEELTQAQVKAQQALSLAFGATTIATNASKLAGDAKLITDRLSLGITGLLTKAIGADTIAKSRQAVATGQATAAQTALNAVMAVNPIFLLVAAVGALIGAYALLNSETESNVETEKKRNAEFERRIFLLEVDERRTLERIRLTKELRRIEGELAIQLEKDETKKAKLRKELNTELARLDVESLDAKKKRLEEELKEEIKAVKAIEDSRKVAVQDLGQSLSFNVTTTKDLLSAQSEATKEVLRELTEEEKKEIEERKKNAINLGDELKKVENDIVIAKQKGVSESKIADIQITQSSKKSLEDRKKDLEDFNKSVERLNKEREKAALDIARSEEDAEIERISLVEAADGKLREDLIKSFDENIKKLKVRRDRDYFDAQKVFNDEVDAFRKAGEEKVKAGIITQTQLNNEISKLSEKFAEEQLAIDKKFNDQIILEEQLKKEKIAEIDQVLQRELTFGDNSTADSRKRIALENLQDQLRINELQIASNRKVDETLIREKQQTNKKVLAAELEALRERIEIDFIESTKNIQGTEEQKAAQLLSLEEQKNKKLENLNKEFKEKEKLLDKENQDEIFRYRLEKLQQYESQVSAIIGRSLDLARAFTELEAVEGRNQVNNLRNANAEKINSLNETYNAEIIALQNSLNNGLLTREQYNQSVEALNKNLNDSTLKLNNELRDKELATQKKAFENEKKLRIAQTTISGIQGALQAFTSAFSTLPPPANAIVGSTLAALVAATTAVQVAAIRKTEFDAGSPNITTPSSGAGGSGGGGGLGGANQLQNAAGGGGGFTQFNPNLTGNPNPGLQGGGGGGLPDQRVYVLESDITATQRRVSLAESIATFG